MYTVEQYIASFEPEVRGRLLLLRQTFFDLLPDTQESIRYHMPAFSVGKNYLYFAAYKKHIGFYPVYNLTGLEEQLALFRGKGTKDSLHFPHSLPLPIDLIREIIRLKAVQ